MLSRAGGNLDNQTWWVKLRKLGSVHCKVPELNPQSARRPINAAGRLTLQSATRNTHWHLYIAGCPKCNPQSAQC
eukprot:754502-Alexandrium_andersonii.AAC.1